MPIRRIEKLLGARLEGRSLRVNNFYLGPALSGTMPHEHSAAINVLGAGLKLWLLVPARSAPAMRNFIYGHVSNISVHEWLLETLPYLLRAVEGASLILQRPGDVVFVPHYWMHAIVNLAFNSGVAISWPCRGPDAMCDLRPSMRAQAASIRELSKGTKEPAARTLARVRRRLKIEVFLVVG